MIEANTSASISYYNNYSPITNTEKFKKCECFMEIKNMSIMITLEVINGNQSG